MDGYRSELCEDEKEKIVREFLPFIKYNAERLSWRLPPLLTVDDLISVGLMGLLEALDRYEEGRVKFKTFAEFRIKGAMLDELRAAEWMPRSVKKKLNDIRSMFRKLEQDLGRAAEDEEVAAALNIPLEEYYSVLQKADAARIIRLEEFEPNGPADADLDVLECIPDTGDAGPLRAIEDHEEKDSLARKIAELPEKEKLVLSLYYWEEMTMKEIGGVLKLTEGRICQLLNRALMILRTKLDTEAGDEFMSPPQGSGRRGG